MASRMLNADIWDVVAQALRGDTATLRACALTNSLISGSMQRELFRAVSVYRSHRMTRLVELLSARPSLASYIRRLDIRDYPALDQLADWVHSRPAHAPPCLGGVEELRLSLDGHPDRDWVKTLSGCFPSLLFLQIRDCSWTSLMCLPSVFPSLQALYLLYPELPVGDAATHESGVSRLALKAFTYMFASDSIDISLPPIAPFVKHGICWERVECLAMDVEFALHLWPALCEADARPLHLFIAGVYNSHFALLQEQIQLCNARGKTVLAGLETMALSVTWRGESHDVTLRTIGELVDSIPSPLLSRLTLLLVDPEKARLSGLDWTPFTDAFQRLHGLSPGTRKALHVPIFAGYQCAALVPMIQSALLHVQEYADVEVVFDKRVDFEAMLPVIHI